MSKRHAFEVWVSARSEPAAEIMTGIQGEVKHMHLDADGLAARGWTDLPKDWSPPSGELWAGGYLETRAIYDSPVFRKPGEEPRTVHLGVDVFAPACTTIFAPVAGTVHSFQANNGELDYGPTIILQHDVADGLTFWTLFGHLSERSLSGLETGANIARGQQIAELGTVDVNGGWSPHLHFQIILDIGEARGDFPGVCKPSERESWSENCPSPYEFLGIALK